MPGQVPGVPDGCPVLRLAGGEPVRVFNALQAPVAERHPEIVTACRALLGQQARAAAMTGSGSTVFGLFREQGCAEAAAAALASGGWRTLVTRTASRGRARLS